LSKALDIGIDHMFPRFEILVVQTVALLITALLIPGLRVRGIVSAVLAVVVLGVLNATVWNTALFFSIPDAVSAHALVVLLANGIFFWVVVKLLPGIEVHGIVAAIAAPVVLTFVSVVIYRIGNTIDWSVFWENLSVFRAQFG
jgi:putative membrane protein